MAAVMLRQKIFLLEALHQHLPDTYLENLGAPRLPFALPLPWLYRNVMRRLKAIRP